MVTGASASPGDGLGETSGDDAAALVATVKTPGRAKTTTAVTMRSRRYKDGLPVAVGVRGEAQSAHGSVDTRVDNSRASVECLQPGGRAVSRVVALRDGPPLLRHRPPRHGVAARRRAATPCLGGRWRRRGGPSRKATTRLTARPPGCRHSTLALELSTRVCTDHERSGLPRRRPPRPGGRLCTACFSSSQPSSSSPCRASLPWPPTPPP